jgi:hypothetical protein
MYVSFSTTHSGHSPAGLYPCRLCLCLDLCLLWQPSRLPPPRPCEVRALSSPPRGEPLPTGGCCRRGSRRSDMGGSCHYIMWLPLRPTGLGPAGPHGRCRGVSRSHMRVVGRKRTDRKDSPEINIRLIWGPHTERNVGTRREKTLKIMKNEESENTMSDCRTRCRLWKRAKRLHVPVLARPQHRLPTYLCGGG